VFLLLQNVFSYYRRCSLTTECVLLLQNVFSQILGPEQGQDVYDDVTYVYDDVTYVYDDVTYVYDDVTDTWS